MQWIIPALFVSLLLLVSWLTLRSRRKAQLQYIKDYRFHAGITQKLLGKYPHLNNEQVHQVFRALRDYFFMCNAAGKNLVAMPSQVVDDAWHEFILFTRSYNTFCRKAFGRFLHHTPTEAMRSRTLATDGIKRAWRLACAKERIDPAKPNRLPLIFAIDSLLEIPNGFNYVPNCKDPEAQRTGNGYCASDIGCAGGCAGDSGSPSDSVSNNGNWTDVFDGLGCSGDSGCGGGCGGD